MRSAIAFLCFCATAAVAAPEHHSREFNGVTASFIFLNRRLRASDSLRVRITLRNQSTHAATFGRMTLSQHIDVFTASGEKVYLKNGAPTLEPVLMEERLKPGEKVQRTEDIELSTWYELAPGDYYVIFRYDLRCLPDPVAKAYMKTLHSEAWVPWDSKKYWFHIHR